MRCRSGARALVAILMTLAAGGCEDGWFGEKDKPPLPGVRLPVLSLRETLKPDPRIADLSVRLPRPTPNDSWPQAGGLPNHAMQHLAAGGRLGRLWRTDIGRGSGSEAELLAQPVVGAGRVYTVDVEADVRAYNLDSGDQVWRVRLGPETDEEGILGGGLALNAGRLFVTTGFAYVFALDARTGKEIWKRRLPGPLRAAPTARDGRVFASTIANELFALDAGDGKVLWSYAGVTETAGILGSAAPAVDDGIVVVPFSSGEVVALRAENGRVVWSETLVALRRSDPVSSLAHIRGLPVIDRGLVFAVANSGRTVAIDLRTGSRVWEQEIGGMNGPWVAGDFVYVVSDQGEAACLSRRDGRVRWVRNLPQYTDEKKKAGPIQWTGPVLVGDRLLVASSTGEIWSISPYTGDLLGRVEAPGPIRIVPAVANQTVLVLTDDADLVALR